MNIAIVSISFMLTTAAAARAQPVNGLYVQGGSGLTLPQQQFISLPTAAPAVPRTSAAASAEAAIDGRPGPAQAGSVGWGIGHGVRMEIEGTHATELGGASN